MIRVVTHVFVFQFGELDNLVIIHKRAKPNLAKGRGGKKKSLGILLFFLQHA
jgi:hypothetical protein